MAILYMLCKTYFKRISVLRCLMKSDRIMLVPLSLAYQEDFYAYTKLDIVNRFTLWDTMKNLGEAKAALKSIIQRNRAGNCYILGVVENESGRLIGTVGLEKLEFKDHKAEVGYSFDHRYWGKGIGTEALRLFLEHISKRYHFHRIEARCVKENIASCKLLEKLGFEKEGLQKDAVYIKDSFADVLLYGKILGGSIEKT